MKSVLIIGYGIVGHNLYNDLEKLCPDVYDKFNTEKNTKSDSKHYDFAFICVDTPHLQHEYPDNDVLCDISQIKIALLENDADIYIIKSAILPYTAEELSKQFGKHIVVSPEYYGATQHCDHNNFDFGFTILGGEKEDCYKVQQLLQEVYDARHTFRVVDSKTAELAKYMENSWLATKVAFCIQFYEACQKLGINYEELRELFILDPRVNPAHTFVYSDHPYYESHCLDKDVFAIAEMLDMDLLQDIIKFNKKQKEKYKNK